MTRRAGERWAALNNRAFYGLDKFDTIGTIIPLQPDTFEGWHTVGMRVELGEACGLGERLSYYQRSLRAAACRNTSRLYYTLDGQAAPTPTPTPYPHPTRTPTPKP